MDVFIPNGPGPLWEHELRFALRSLHLYAQVDRVFILGWKPWWLVNAIHIPVKDKGGPPNANTLLKLACVAGHTDISPQFIFSHDDIFLLRPLEEQVCHVATSPARSYVHREAMLNAARIINRPAVVDYELHTPVVLDKEHVQRTLGLIRTNNVAFRTVYFNTLGVASTPMEDVKLMTWKEPGADWPCFSIGPKVGNDRKFKEYVQRRFSQPCPWEQA